MAVPQINEHESAGTVGEPAAPASKAASNGHPAGESARPEIPEAADLVAMLDMLLPGGTVGALHRFRPDASTLRCAVRLALRPDALARRTTTLASELREGRGRHVDDRSGPPRSQVRRSRVEREPDAEAGRPGLPGHQPGRRGTA